MAASVSHYPNFDKNQNDTVAASVQPHLQSPKCSAHSETEWKISFLIHYKLFTVWPVMLVFFCYHFKK